MASNPNSDVLQPNSFQLLVAMASNLRSDGLHFSVSPSDEGTAACGGGDPRPYLTN